MEHNHLYDERFKELQIAKVPVYVNGLSLINITCNLIIKFYYVAYKCPKWLHADKLY